MTSFEQVVETEAVHEFWDTAKYCEKLFSWLGNTTWVYRNKWLKKSSRKIMFGEHQKETQDSKQYLLSVTKSKPLIHKRK